MKILLICSVYFYLTQIRQHNLKKALFNVQFLIYISETKDGEFQLVPILLTPV